MKYNFIKDGKKAKIKKPELENRPTVVNAKDKGKRDEAFFKGAK